MSEFCDRCEVIGGCGASTRNVYTWMVEYAAPSKTCANHRYDRPTTSTFAGTAHTDGAPHGREASTVVGVAASYNANE